MVHDSLPRDARSRYSSAYALWAMVERCRVPFMATVVGILDLDSWGADTLDAGPPRLAVVVIALGAPVETVDAVRSLLEQKPQVEIVVVNSGGGMAALLARHGIDLPVIEHEERLYAGVGRNIGIKATRAPYVAFLASDCRATEGWARKRLAAHRTGLAAVGSAMETASRITRSPEPLIWHYDRGACRARAEDCPMAPPTTGACSKSTDISARICALARTTNSTDDCRPGRNGTRESSRCIAIQRDCFRSLPINIGAANALPALSIARPIWKIRYTRYLEAAKIAAARFVFAPVV